MQRTVTPLDQLSFYSLFTKYTFTKDYGLSSGLISRFFRKIVPIVPDDSTIEYVLSQAENPVSTVLDQLDFSTISDGPIAKQLDLSIKALCAKVIAFGLDKDIKAKYTFLELDAQPFSDLLVSSNNLQAYKKTETAQLINALDQVDALIVELRKNKHRIGTNFQLTLTTRRMLDYTQRIKELLRLKLNIDSRKHWESLLKDWVAYAAEKHSIRRYLRRRSDLVALEIVEHTASKGEKYIADSKKEYWTFLYRSLWGGSIIALFALVKMLIGALEETSLSNAFWYGLNYAACFILVKYAGGIIATKQPAMTASTIAEHVDRKDELKIDSVHQITLLVRKVFRSQFISIIGNLLMALTVASVITWLFKALQWQQMLQVIKPDYLMKSVAPSFQLVFFAAVAGVFLALSGLISGYVDNKMVASKLAYRIRHLPSLFNNERLAYFVEKKLGALLGNLCLGFMLGSAFLLSYILPFKIDIRHIAFSSANVGYSITKETFEPQTILWVLLGVLTIGLVNLIVSFAITLYLALQSRGANLSLVPKIIWDILKDFLRYPLCYIIHPRDDRSERVTVV